MDLLKDKNFFPKDIRVLPEPTPIAVELIEASSNKGPTATFSTQTMLLFKREWRTLKRAPTLFVTSTVAAAVLSVVSSILLLGIGAKDKAINGVRIFVVVTGILSVLTCFWTHNFYAFLHPTLCHRSLPAYSARLSACFYSLFC